MAIGFELALLAALAGLTAIIGLRFMWISHRIPNPRRIRYAAIQPAARTKHLIEESNPGSAFITMPHHLQTNDEVVAWMTKELPRLTSKRTGKPRV